MKTTSRIRLLATAVVAAALAAPSIASADVYNVAIATNSSRFTSVLDVAGGSTAPGAKVIQYFPTGGGNQRWNFVGVPDSDRYQIVNAKTGFCLTTNGLEGSQLSVTYCNTANPRQLWTGIPQFKAEFSSAVFVTSPTGSLTATAPVPGPFGSVAFKYLHATVQDNSGQSGAAIVTAAGTFADVRGRFAYWYWG
jgi:hypothetical protein